MAEIDERLLEPDGKPELVENFNRVLAMLDDAEPSAGPPGPQGVGIQAITGTIDASNKLTLNFQMTDGSTQTVEGTITPPAAI